MYPAQNGDVQKLRSQEHKVDIPNDVKKEEEANSVATGHNLPATVTLEMSEHSRDRDVSREAESSSNGPTNAVLTV